MGEGMRAALDPRRVRRLSDTRSYLRVEFGYGTVGETAELFRDMAVTCLQNNLERALIIAADDDLAHERSLRDALTVMVLAEISRDFRLALVIDTPRVALAYVNFQRDVSAVGIATRVFETEEAATFWLAR
jgi:hypothetical protein